MVLDGQLISLQGGNPSLRKLVEGNYFLRQSQRDSIEPWKIWTDHNLLPDKNIVDIPPKSVVFTLQRTRECGSQHHSLQLCELDCQSA